MNKLEKYQISFEEIKKNEISSKSLFELNILQTQLMFDVIDALKTIAQQNQKNTKKIETLENKIQEILGQPISLSLSGEKDEPNNRKIK